MGKQKSYHHYTEEELLYIEVLWRDGASAKNIAYKLGVSTCSIQSLIGNNRDRFPHRRKPYPDNEVAEIARLWNEDGLEIAEIAKISGRSIESLSTYMRKHQALFEHRSQTTTTPEQRQQMVEMRRSGMLCKDIAKVFGISRKTVSQYTSGVMKRG